MKYSFPYDRAYATPAEIGTTINPTTVIDTVKDFVLTLIITTVSTDSHIDVGVLRFFHFFFDF